MDILAHLQWSAFNRWNRWSLPPGSHIHLFDGCGTAEEKFNLKYVNFNAFSTSCRQPFQFLCYHSIHSSGPGNNWGFFEPPIFPVASPHEAGSPCVWLSSFIIINCQTQSCVYSVIHWAPYDIVGYKFLTSHSTLCWSPNDDLPNHPVTWVNWCISPTSVQQIVWLVLANHI